MQGKTEPLTERQDPGPIWPIAYRGFSTHPLPRGRTPCAPVTYSRNQLIHLSICGDSRWRASKGAELSIERHVSNPATGFAEAVTNSGPGRLIHVSGTVGFGEDGKIVSGGMGAEARATFANIASTLEAAGASLADVVSITAYITNIHGYPEYAEVRSELFAGHLPASATVQVAGLVVNAQIEIDAVAFVS